MKISLAIAATGLLLTACNREKLPTNDTEAMGWVLKGCGSKGYTEKKIQVLERGKPTRTIYVWEY